MALLTEIEKLPLTAAEVVVLFGVLTRRGCSSRDVATALVLIDPAESGSMTNQRAWCLACTLSARFEICNGFCSCESAYETRRHSIAFFGVIAFFFAFGYFFPRDSQCCGQKCTRVRCSRVKT